MSSEVKANKLSPATGTDVVLGDASDTFTIPASATLDVNGTIDVTGATVTGLSAGKVLQVVQTFKNDTWSTSDTDAFMDITGFEANITPSSTSNKILFTASCQFGAANVALFRLMRDSTELAPATSDAGYNSALQAFPTSTASGLLASFSYLDSPSSTSAITYKVQVKNRASGYSTYLNRSADDSNDSGYGFRGASSIILMEIEG
jgi:hypothetical protein|tara:strand:+ start:11 stop:625 length:615 start_codon:yes stop_codon:yes gene_type:complete